MADDPSRLDGAATLRGLGARLAALFGSRGGTASRPRRSSPRVRPPLSTADALVDAGGWTRASSATSRTWTRVPDAAAGHRCLYVPDASSTTSVAVSGLTASFPSTTATATWSGPGEEHAGTARRATCPTPRAQRREPRPLRRPRAAPAGPAGKAPRLRGLRRCCGSVGRSSFAGDLGDLRRVMGAAGRRWCRSASRVLNRPASCRTSTATASTCGCGDMSTAGRAGRGSPPRRRAAARGRALGVAGDEDAAGGESLETWRTTSAWQPYARRVEDDGVEGPDGKRGAPAHGRAHEFSRSSLTRSGGG